MPVKSLRPRVAITFEPRSALSEEEFLLATGALEHWAIPLQADRRAVDDARRLLSPEELRRSSSFYFERDRRRYVIAHAMMRLLLGMYTSCAPQELQLGSNDNGKPFLSRPNRSIHFNLSHSGDLALLAISGDNEMGVDIEQLAKLHDRDALAERMFSTAERHALKHLHEDLRDLSFLLCWTRKEAYAKAIGDGLRTDFQKFDVNLTPHTRPRLIAINCDRTAAQAWSLFVLSPFPGYVGATAIQARPRRCTGRILDIRFVESALRRASKSV